MSDFRESLPRPNPFQCSAAVHLWRYGLALAIYQKVGEITNGGERTYYTDTAIMARLFGADKAHVRRTFAALNRIGLLVVVGGTKKVKIRQWVLHKDWAKANPGKCVAVDSQLVPWSAGTDPLCGQINAAFDGKIRLYEAYLKHARSSGASDSEIVAALAANWRIAKEKRARKEYARISVKSVFFDTVKALAAGRATVASAAYNTRSKVA